jgi:hypothetical protein
MYYRTGELSPSCPIYTNLVNRHGHFLIDRKTCLIYRSTKGNMPFKEELETLAPDPLMWHGNGMQNDSFSKHILLLNIEYIHTNINTYIHTVIYCTYTHYLY